MIKKLFAVAAATGLIISLAGSTPAHNQEEKDSQPGQKVERTVAVTPHATITLCVGSGTLVVRGWDRAEVRVRSIDAQELELRRVDKVKDPAIPASRIDVMVLEKTARVPARLDCQAIADVEMEVPAGATVQVQTRDGDINIAGVAAAYAGSQNGDIIIERVTKLVEAGSVGGSILLKDSSGRVNLSSAGGGVEVINVRAASVEDTLEVGTVSGDIQLVRISNPKVMAKTVSGRLMMSGALIKAGSYAFTNMTGDVVLAMPSDASFRLSAKVSEKRLLVSDFALTYLSETPPPSPAPMPAPAPGIRTPAPGPPAAQAPQTPLPKNKEKEKPAVKGRSGEPPSVLEGPVVVITKPPTVVVPYVRRIEAICGSGDSLISVASFGGTVRLRKL